MKKKEETVSSLTKGIEFLFRKNKVSKIEGCATLLDGKSIQCRDKDGRQRVVSASHIVIATGSVPARIKNIETDEESIVTSTGALSLPRIPERLIIVGAGIIGLELGSIWSRLGSSVTFIELTSQIGSAMDPVLAYLMVDT